MTPGLLDREMTKLQVTPDGTTDPPLYPPYEFDQTAQALDDIADHQSLRQVIGHA